MKHHEGEPRFNKAENSREGVEHSWQTNTTSIIKWRC